MGRNWQQENSIGLQKTALGCTPDQAESLSALLDSILGLARSTRAGADYVRQQITGPNMDSTPSCEPQQPLGLQAYLVEIRSVLQSADSTLGYIQKMF